MKTSVLNLVRGGVFVLAAVFAFAFTQPLSIMNGFGAERDANGDIVQFHDISLLNPQDYDCIGTSEGCIYEEADEESDVITPGLFVLTNR
ncbi:hypothetical protein SAMN06295967_12118 [Belliella buryatensis]|uniref:Uncharacterized protein n=1 Tax=Belliella buryatensis TaxID=1500549 RepID=A0A239H142_9BACT|nr:hypothetical protein [Belliella buryatensis]SNS74523.1 hypothetical protein SAMN06295967_12118 [Belliella buryatensis]